MNFDARLRSLLTRSVWVLLLALSMGLLLAGPSYALKGSGYPADPVPGPGQNGGPRWNSTSTLQPALIMYDSTKFAGHSDPKHGDTLEFHALDIENGMLFAATGQGLQIFNVNSGPNGNPLSYIYGYFSSGSFPGWEHVGDKDWFITHLDAPANNSSVVGLGMDVQGFSVINTASPAGPIVAYVGKDGFTKFTQVYAVNSAGADWAYVLDSDGNIYRFNMSVAATMTRCLDNTPGTACPGVYKGKHSAMGAGWSSIAGTGKFMVTGARAGAGKISIWDVSDPASPAQLMQLTLPGRGVALWQSGSSYYLARVDLRNNLTIHDVSCIAGGACSSAPQVWTSTLAAPTSNPLAYVTASQDAGRAYLYVGGDDLGTCLPQREHILDVSNPSSPQELTPKLHPDGYWGWYYQNCTETGYNLVGPRIGKVFKGHLYRAAMSILDAHKIGQAGPPVANFSWPSTLEIYPDTPVQFTDLSSGSPNTWTWQFQDGTPGNSSAQNPTVSFGSAGQKTISLDVFSSQYGPGTPKTDTLTVRDPKPVVASATASPLTVLQCQPVTLTGTGISGKPALSYAWDIQGPSAVTGGSTNPFTWNTTANTTPGTYTATLTVSNADGAAAKSVSVTVNQVQPITTTTFAPTNDLFTAGTVKFHVAVANATEWSWDFDDDMNPDTANFGPWLTDPADGPNPSHSFSVKGIHNVRVKVRNCVTGEITSQVLPVDIKVVTPLKAQFSISAGALCFPGTDVCSADGGVPITFMDVSTGADVWRFDWNGDGDYADPDEGELSESAFTTVGNARTINHTFQQSGEYFPKLLVRRGTSETDLYTLDKKLIIGTVQQPGISVSGPSSGKPGTALSFTAQGTGSCKPNASGWTWTAPGGTITGGTTDSVTISFAASGNKTVSATNSACGQASGSKTVIIANDQLPTGLKAEFSYTPTTPGAGQAVAFNGAASTGTPETYIWNFGDGSPIASGAQASHTFAQSGSYRVTLSVTKAGSCPPAPFCEASVTKTVVVGTGEPPLGASFTTSATCVSEFGLNICTAETGSPVTFTSTSTGTPTSTAWTFGDGGTASGNSATHTFQQPGTFTVTLTVGKGANTATASKTFNVNAGNGEGPLVASFTTSATCAGGGCTAGAGQAVTFTSTSTGNPTSLNWSFGDGGSATGASATHTFQQAGTFTVTLSIGKGANTSSSSRTFTVEAGPRPESSTIVLPWVAQSRGALKNTSNLFIHNPGTTPMEIVLEFRRQGTPEANPPRAARTIQPGATLYVVDVLKGLFNVENTIGFVTVTKLSGDRDPVTNSFNSIAGQKGAQYGQTVPGVRLGNPAAAAATVGARVQSLVGLSDNADRQAYFGITNPNPEQAVYRLKFYDSLGRPIGTPSADLTLPSFGQKQYLVSEIRSLFGITTEDDYRVEVETVSGGNLYPYGTNVQTISKDPSYQGVGQSKARLYLIGAMRTKGLNKSEWQSDVVLANPGTQVALADVSFLNAGPTAQLTAPITLTLQPGQTERLENIGKRWNVKDSVGLVVVESDAPDGVFPIVQGESYLSSKSKPGSRYGLAMAAMTDEDAADAGEVHTLVGLRHDVNNRSTVWILNPSLQAATYDLIYRGLDGKILGRIDNVTLGGAKLRQFSPSQHPLKAITKKGGGVPGGFTLQIVVKSGKALAAAQVVNNKTNDPSYIAGETR